MASIKLVEPAPEPILPVTIHILIYRRKYEGSYYPELETHSINHKPNNKHIHINNYRLGTLRFNLEKINTLRNGGDFSINP